MTELRSHYDIAVVGAGVVGLSTAFRLSEQASVVVLEQEDQPGYHSSGRSAAMFIEGYENSTVAHLTSAGRDFFHRPPQGFATAPLLHPRGGLTIAAKNEQARLKKYLDTWQTYCPELIEIDAHACREMVTNLRSSWIGAGAYDPTWLAIDVHELVSGFRRGLKANNGELLTLFQLSELTKTSSRDNAPWQLSNGKVSITANVVVNAAGAWAENVAQLAGLDGIDLTPMRRTAAIIPAPENALDWPLVHTISESLYFKPESPGLMICPQDETPSPAMDAYPHDIDVALAVEQLAEVLDHPVERVLHQWAGLRTFADDRKPVVGFDPRARGFYWVAGLGGFGVQTAPGLSEYVSAEILARPGRTALVPSTEQSAINVNRWLD